MQAYPAPAWLLDKYARDDYEFLPDPQPGPK